MRRCAGGGGGGGGGVGDDYKFLLPAAVAAATVWSVAKLALGVTEQPMLALAYNLALGYAMVNSVAPRGLASIDTTHAAASVGVLAFMVAFTSGHMNAEATINVLKGVVIPGAYTAPALIAWATVAAETAAFLAVVYTAVAAVMTKAKHSEAAVKTAFAFAMFSRIGGAAFAGKLIAMTDGMTATLPGGTAFAGWLLTQWAVARMLAA